MHVNREHRHEHRHHQRNARDRDPKSDQQRRAAEQFNDRRAPRRRHRCRNTDLTEQHRELRGSPVPFRGTMNEKSERDDDAHRQKRPSGREYRRHFHICLHYAECLFATISTNSIDGGAAKSSTAAATSCRAISPETCARRPSSSAKVSKIPKRESSNLNAYHCSVCASDCASNWADLRNASTSSARPGFAFTVASMPIRSMSLITVSQVEVATTTTRNVNARDGRAVPNGICGTFPIRYDFTGVRLSL